VAATADPRHRDYFKPDFFNGIGQNEPTAVKKANDG
jgi:hypothetical protein